jgi:molybdopterin-guanine dinucleotide biosynthesis protein
MAIVVVGGHSRNIGKTSVVAELIAAMPERRWTAIKITQYGHGVCSANGAPCDCVVADHSLALSEEHDAASGTDTSRFLAAGAERVWWLRTQHGELAAAMPRLRALLAAAEGDVIVESNSVLRFLQPDVFVSVLDPAVADFKPSALRYLDRADAIVLPEGADVRGAWEQVAPSLLRRARAFACVPGAYASAGLKAFVAERLSVARART